MEQMQIVRLRTAAFVNTAYHSIRGFLPATAQTLLDKITSWLTETTAGRITIGLATYLLARPIIDRVWRSIHRYPPGTIGVVPLLSTIRDVSSLDHGFLLKQPSYGKVSMHYAGRTPFVLLNSRKAMEDAYMEAGLVDRQPEMAPDKLQAMEDRFRPVIGSTPFPGADGPHAWFQRRKFLYSSLIGLLNATILDGMVGGRMEDKVFPKFLNEESKEDGYIWNDLRQDMTRTIFNTLFSTTFGLEFQPSEEQLEEFSECVLGFGQIFFSIIISRKMPARLQKPTITFMTTPKQRSYFKKIDSFLREWLERYKSETAGESVHKLYADTMIEASNNGAMSMDDIIADISGVYFAGVHTTSATLEQSILYLVRKPEIQERIHQDLVKAFPKASFEIGSSGVRPSGSAGTEGGISLKGLKSVHSLRAFGYEIQRLATALPLTLSRCVRKSFETEGFIIPEGSIVFGNLYSIGRDIDIWGDDADDFSIDRWLTLDENGSEKLDNSKLDDLVTFGIGRRSCPGRSMADRQIQLVLGFLLRFFKIESPTGNPNDAPILSVNEQLQNTTSFPVKITRRIDSDSD